MAKTGIQPNSKTPEFSDFERRLNEYVKGVQTIQAAMDRLREIDRQLKQHSEWLDEIDKNEQTDNL